MSLLGGYFAFWFLSPLWTSGECDACVLPVFLACSTGMFTGNVCWFWRLGYWDELGEGGLDEKEDRMRRSL